MRYRKDVQMLRGVAVLLVVLYHLGFSTFESGFLGVDVFFVISGYLMAVMYRPDDKRGFFTKRARRLLPAYFATVLATLLVAALITRPNDFDQVVSQSWFAIAFASNIGFWLENSYFEKAAFMPLLHLWSLGVEIQFYLLVPVLYWFLKKGRAPGYWALVLGSMVACFFMVGISNKTSFFWLPFRLWEFLFGFGIATFLAMRNVPRAPWMGALGLALILLIPVVPVNGMAKNFVYGHPGFIAAAICAATAVVLMYGLPGSMQANPLATGIERLGNWSYSIYLAHFPVIVLVLYQPFSGTVLDTNSVGQFLTVAALVVTGSTVLYRYVEAPFRHRGIHASWVVGTVGGLLVLGVLGGVLQEFRTSAAEKLIYAAWQDRAPYRCGKVARVLHPMTHSCEITPTLASPALRILLAGDSHADAIKVTFAQAAAEQNATVFLTDDNAPLQPQAIMKEALARNVNSIALILHPNNAKAEPIAKLAGMAKENSISVIFVMPVPIWPEHVPKAMWQHTKFGLAEQVQNLAAYQAATEPIRHQLAAAKATNLVVYESAGAFCESSCRFATDGGKPLYFDKNHLTLTGSALLRPLFDRIVREAKALEVLTDSTKSDHDLKHKANDPAKAIERVDRNERTFAEGR